jgi:hypothetical protein
MITVEGAPLPFPDEIADDALAAIGPVPVTPIGDGIAQTIELISQMRDEGRLVPEEQGLGA